MSSENEKQKDKKPKMSKKKILDRVIIAFLALVFIGCCSGGIILYNIVGKVDPSGMVEQMQSDEPSIFLANDGKTVIGELGAESRENITYEQIPQSTIDAFLAIEDSRYFKHNGFDLPRFISSAINNLKSSSLSQGGSTLTMQTVDNFIMKPVEDQMALEGKYFSSVEKIERKIQEIYLSLYLDNELSKEDIITRYLNQINFGQQIRGIQKGAEYYFGKNVEDLNLSESAFLAGVINAPNNNNPYMNYEQAKTRRDETLYQMLNHGYITETEYKLAKSTKLAFQVAGEPDSTNTDPYKDYVRAAADEILDKYGVDPATTPMTVYTSLDVNAQKSANEAASGNIVNLTNNKYYQIGFTVLDNSNGEIIAVCAGRDDIESADSIDHFRFRETHQPGSSIKPIFDYAPAFDKLGYCTSRVYVDKKMEIGGWKVVNSDGKYLGKVSMERAIAQSLNTTAVQTFEALLDTAGYDEMMQYALNLGFSEKSIENMDIQYSIGASGMVASPTEMAGAYAALANGGVYNEPHMVRKIVYKNEDKTIEAKYDSHQAMSSQSAYMTSELLYKAIFGEYNGWNLMGRLGFGAYPVYGKTGTSDWAEDAWKYGGAMKDEWMINYTSEYTIATWSGFDKGIEGEPTYITTDMLYANIPGKINKYMLDSIATGNEHRIARPSGISSYGGGLIKTEWLSQAKKNNPMTVENSKTDSKALEKALKEAKAYKESDFTADSFKALQAAIKNAEELLENELSPQEDIDKAKNALNSAMENLVSNANKDRLNEAIQKASAIDTSKYSAESIQTLQKALDSAKKVYDDKKSTQSSIDEQTNALNNALNGLQSSIDRTVLYNTIISAQSINPNTYTADSYRQFQEIVSKAITVYENPNATQDEINQQINIINTAYSTVLKPV